MEPIRELGGSAAVAPRSYVQEYNLLVAMPLTDRPISISVGSREGLACNMFLEPSLGQRTQANVVRRHRYRRLATWVSPGQPSTASAISCLSAILPTSFRSAKRHPKAVDRNSSRWPCAPKTSFKCDAALESPELAEMIGLFCFALAVLASPFRSKLRLEVTG